MKFFKSLMLFFYFVIGFSFSQAIADQPKYWDSYLSSAYNQAIYAQDSAHSGARSLKLINYVSAQSNWHGATINYTAPYPKMFTFSGWAKGSNVASSSLAALDFYIVFEDNSTLWYYSDTKFGSGSYNWKNKAVTKTFNKGVKSVTPYLILYNGKGTIWFDDVEVNAFQNTVLNSSIEQGTTQPDNWLTHENNLDNKTGWATDAYYSPRHSLKITNTLYKNADWAGANISFAPPYSRTVTLGGFSKSSSVYLRSGGKYRLNFSITFADGTKQEYSPNALSFATGTHAWQKREITVTFPKLIKEIKPFCYLYNGRGSAWFDDIYALVKGLNSASNPGMEEAATDITAPTGTIIINNGAQYTDSTTVTLNLSAQDNPGGSGLSQMKFSNDNTNWSTPELYATTKTWNLTSGDGQKTVYVQFSDQAGNWSNSFSDPDGIILDTLRPEPPMINPVTSPTNTNSQTITGTKSQDSLSVIVVCSTAVVQAVTYPTVTTWSCELTALSPGVNTITVKAQDAAGNESAPAVTDLEYIAPATYWILVDEYDYPLPGSRESGGWFFNCTGGDRGKLREEDAAYSWDNNSAYTASIARISVPGGLWTYAGMWYSLIRVDNDNKPLNFKNIFGPYIKPEFQGKIKELAIAVNSVSSTRNNAGLKLRVEIKGKNKQIVHSQEFTNLLNQAYPKVFTVNLDLPVVQDIEQITWVFDNAWPGDSISVDSLKLKAEVPTVSSAQQAFYWTYSWLMANYNPNTGMVKDKSRDGPTQTGGDSMESVTATAKTAKATYYAYKKGYITYDNAVAIITKIANTLINVVPRGPQGKNTIWPHFTENGGTVAVPPRTPHEGSEWSSGDTTYAALDMIAALRMIGDPKNQISQFENFLTAINWQDLLLSDGSISHGYKYGGTQITYGWSGFGMEAMGVNWAYAAATGNITNMLPPPTDNGSGFIENAHYPMVFYTGEDGKDGWGNDWDAYRLDAAEQQISWYSTTAHYNQYLNRANLFGLSAGEVPDVVVNPGIAVDYKPYGTGGKSTPEDGNGEVVTLHYSGMVADKRPAEAIRMWEALRDRNIDFLQNRIIISPLNNMESMRVDKNTGKMTVNHLKGSWNLSLQAEGWALADPVIRADLHAAVQNNAFLKRGYDILHQSHVFPRTLRVPQDYPTIQAAIDAAQAGDKIAVTPGQPTLNGNIILNKAGIILDGGGNTLASPGTDSVILCRDIDGADTVIRNCNIFISNRGLICEGSVKRLKVENSTFGGNGGGLGIQLLDGADATIQKNIFRNCAILSALGNNHLEFIENDSRPTIGPNYGGIYLSSGTALIKGNILRSTWDGAITLNNADATLINNHFDFCQGWGVCGGVRIFNSIATLKNNLFRYSWVYSGTGEGVSLHAVGSTVNLYNNIFSGASGPSAIKGVALWARNTNLSAKNNIFYKNAQGQSTVFFEGTGTQDFSYNNFWANTTTSDTTGITLGAGNIKTNPFFVSAESSLNDFHLGAGSLCINAGDPDAQYNDKDGTRNDLGIYGGPNVF